MRKSGDPFPRRIPSPEQSASPVFEEYDPNQTLPLSPNLNDWLPEDYLARSNSDMVEESLDPSPLLERYRNASGGPSAVRPNLLTKPVVYGYAIDVRSSRNIERATSEELAFRWSAANRHPDHNAIARYREKHLEVLDALFLRGLEVFRAARDGQARPRGAPYH